MGVISRSDLLNASGSVDRLDAEFYDEAAIALEARLKAAGCRPLANSAAIRDIRVPDPGKGVPPESSAEFDYLEISDVDPLDGFALPKAVPVHEASPRARMSLCAGAVVVSSVRPARNAVFLADIDQARAIGSTGFIVLAATGIEPEVLFALMKSRTSVAQLARRGRASMYPALYPPDVLDVLVPTLPPARTAWITVLVRRARSERRKYMVALAAAESAADEFFDQADPTALLNDLRSSQCRIVSKAGLFTAGRLDAEFHAQTFQDVQSRLRKLGVCKTLGQLCLRADTGRTPASHEYQEVDPAAVAVMKVAALTNRGINWPSVGFAPSAKYAGQADSEILDGDIVFTSSAHSAGHIAKKVDVVRDVPSDLRGRVTFAGEVMRLRLKDDPLFPPEYVAAFLRSPLGGEQVRRCTRGITSHVYGSDILANVLVPAPDAATAGDIRREALRANDARLAYRRNVLRAIAEVDKHVDQL